MRYISFFVVLVLVLGFGALAYSQTMQTGTFTANKGVEGYSLDNGSGERTVTMEVNFAKPFDTKPTVIVSVNSIDADRDTNLRFELKTVSVSRDGFSIVVKTWADSKINFIGGTWMAYAGAAPK